MELDFKAKKDLWVTKKKYEDSLKKWESMKFEELDPASELKEMDKQIKWLGAARGQIETTMPNGNPVLEQL
jgi:hypothetical protein